MGLAFPMVAPWGVFFYAPAIVFFGWTVAELAPTLARRARRRGLAPRIGARPQPGYSPAAAVFGSWR